MIETAIGKFAVRGGEALKQLEKDQASRSDARAGLELMSNQIREELGVQRQRINELIVDNNKTSSKHRSGIEAVVATFHSPTTELASGICAADAKFDALNAGIDTYADQQRIAMETIKIDMEARVVAIRQELSDQAQRFNVDTFGAFRAGGGAYFASMGLPRGADQGRASSVDRKDVTVWKLPEQVTKQEFRQWLDTIDTNLDAVHRFKLPEVVLTR